MKLSSLIGSLLIASAGFANDYNYHDIYHTLLVDPQPVEKDTNIDGGSTEMKKSIAGLTCIEEQPSFRPNPIYFCDINYEKIDAAGLFKNLDVQEARNEEKEKRENIPKDLIVFKKEVGGLTCNIIVGTGYRPVYPTFDCHDSY